jgi:integrase
VLTDTKIRTLKPREKAFKTFDGGGLYIHITPKGGRWWRLKYRYAGREKLLSLGTYPDTSLKLARSKRDDARTLLAKNIDPSSRRHEEKAALTNTLSAVAEEWFKAGSPGGKNKQLKPVTIVQLHHRYDKYLKPKLGKMPVASIAVRDLRSVLLKIQDAGNHETAHRVRALAERIFRFAIATGRADRNIAADLRGTLIAVTTRHFSAVTDPDAVGQLLRAIDGYQGQPAVMYALRLAPYVFVRPGELRGARWSEIDLNTATWVIPEHRMKMSRPHTVLLSTQVLTILWELKEFTGEGELLFPGLRSKHRSISDNSLNAALRRLGYAKDEMTAHGFRTTASTRLHELGFESGDIELQLAHLDRNQIRATYNKAERLTERRKMMQAWSDYLDGLRADKRGRITALRRGQG